MKKFFLTYHLFFGLALLAQEIKNAPLKDFYVSGNYRFYAQHRLINNPYIILSQDGIDQTLSGRSILVGDASQLPELTLNIGGRPSSKTSFGTDLIVWNQNNGDFDYYRNLQLGINLYCNINLDHGDLNIKTGGIHWHEISPLTLGSFFGYNRYSVFERNPWDPQHKDIATRYKNYAQEGAINQDLRWANQAFQGFMLNYSANSQTQINVLYGKTQNTSSAIEITSDNLNDQLGSSNMRFFTNTLPSVVAAGNIIQPIKKHYVSLNTINQIGYSDEIGLDKISNNIFTGGFKIDLSSVVVEGELGAGKYANVYNQDTLGFGQMADISIDLDKKLTLIPIHIHLYRLSPRVINNNASFINASVDEALAYPANQNQNIASNGVIQQTGSGILPMGQMSNNRQGIDVSAEVKVQKLWITIANGFAREIEKIGNNISFVHLNGLTMSRFWRWSFPSDVGPYGRKSVLFRSLFETVNITDLDINGDMIYFKNFNTTETQLKYESKIYNRSNYTFYLGTFNSVQKDFSFWIVPTERAFLRVYNHQIENYYQVHPKCVLAQYLGVERIIGNYSTQINEETKRPLNQTGMSVGIGIDYMMAKNTGLYLRHRYFRFNDKSFPKDAFEGNETTLEIKVMF